MAKPTPIEKALAKFDGSPTKMAAAIGGKVLRQHVEHWSKEGRRVPTEHVRRVCEITGMGPWEFRPDDWFLIWPELIGQKGAPKVPASAEARPTAHIVTPTYTGPDRRKPATDKKAV